MSDQHPRPWSITEIGWIIDADGGVVAYELGDDNDRPTADLIVAAVNAHSPWISVDERLPEENTAVLAANGDFAQSPAWYRWVADDSQCGGRHASWSNDAVGRIDVTHWKPLPAPP